MNGEYIILAREQRTHFTVAKIELNCNYGRKKKKILLMLVRPDDALEIPSDNALLIMFNLKEQR